ncbi:MAG: ABC transporter permease [Rhodobacteraceae bacterium]|nr:ABC transporter permease [Paracoccaceae bacterium]QEW18155.1 Spermidine/putrescine transport system permease protein PotB [Marinibacterium anthonyi]
MTDQALDMPATTSGGSRALAFLRTSGFWLAVPGVAFLLVWFVAPSLQMMGTAFVDKAGDFSMAGFERMFTSPLYRRVLSTTFTVGFQVAVICVVLGYPLAYWLATLSGRSQRVLMMLVLLPFWTSALVKNFSWLVLLGRNGVVSAVLGWMGIDGGQGMLFSRPTVVFGMAHTMLPLAVITMLPVLNQIDKGLMSAARTLGAGNAQAFWRIYFHLSMRGVATAFLLVFVASLGFFITPALLGSPKETLIGQIIIMQIQQLQNWQFGAVLALVLMASTLLAILVFDRIFGISSVTGGDKPRSSSNRFRKVGLWINIALAEVFARIETFWGRNVKGLQGRWILNVYCVLLILLLLFPIVGFIPMAFTSNTFMAFPPDGFSLRWFDTFFSSPLWVSATIRSFVVGTITAALTLAIATMVALALVRSKGRAGTAVFLLFISPMVVPPIVIATSLFYVFADIGLIATTLGIIIGHTVIAMPIVFVVLLATFKGHDWRLDQAASTLGASPLAIAWRITLPLVKPGIIVGFITGFLQSFEELTITMFIGGGLITTLPKQMWDDILLQVNPTLAAASVIVLLVVTALFVLMEIFGSSAAMSRRTGK